MCHRNADPPNTSQSDGRRLDLAMVKAVNNIATGGLKPDLTILLDISAKEGLARKKKRDRFEQEDIAFHQRVREGYLKLAKEEPERWLVIDAAQSREKIAQFIWQRVSHLLTEHGFRDG